jgi:hypothetical protein
MGVARRRCRGLDVDVIECPKFEWLDLVASEHGPKHGLTRLVLCVLALHMNQQGGSCFPSQTKIAKRAGISVRSVRHHIGLAVDGGWLKVEGQKLRRGHASFVNDYTATIRASLVLLTKTPPWVDDPTWKQAAAPAGRSNGNGQAAADAGGSPSESKHPAPDARQAALGAKPPAANDTTPGNLRTDTRQELPTNSSSESSINFPKNTSENVPPKPAALGEGVFETVKEPEPIPEAARREIAEVIQKHPRRTNVEVRQILGDKYGTQDIRQVRDSMPMRATG